MKLRAFILLVLLGLLSGCSSEPTSAADPENEISMLDSDVPLTAAELAALANVEFVLQEWLTADGPRELVEDSRITIRLTPDGGVGGQATVNRYFGSMTLSAGGEVQWGDGFGSTRMAGPEPMMQQEGAYLKALMETDRAYLEGEKIIFVGSDGVPKLVFAPSRQA